MSCSQKQAVITLLEKSGKDRALLENWRPISLVIILVSTLNVDTKIMSKVIAPRVKKVLPSIIHYNQTGYVKDRFIGEAIHSIFNIMDFTAKENIPGLLLFIDCVVPENIHTPTMEGFLICPPPTPQDFLFQGVFDDLPSSQELPEFLNGDFTYHLLEIQSGFGT